MLLLTSDEDQDQQKMWEVKRNIWTINAKMRILNLEMEKEKDKFPQKYKIYSKFQHISEQSELKNSIFYVS